MTYDTKRYTKRRSNFGKIELFDKTTRMWVPMNSLTIIGSKKTSKEKSQ